MEFQDVVGIALVAFFIGLSVGLTLGWRWPREA
jgi:hypothetical protein